MKIVHVVDSMEVGGAETLVSQMCRLQRDQGHDPSILAVATLGPLGEKLRAEGFTVQPERRPAFVRLCSQFLPHLQRGKTGRCPYS